MRKSFLRVIGITLTFCVLLSACSTSGTNKKSETKEQVNTEDMKGKTLKYWYPMWQAEADFTGSGNMGDLWIYKQIEKETGVKIDWIHPPIADADAQVAYNVLIASKDLPDIITHPYYTYYPGGSDKAIADKVFLNLKDLMKNYSPNYWKLINEDTETLKNVTTDEGNIWSYYMIDNFAQKSYIGIIYRKDLLDKINAKLPTTINEMHDVLVQFKDKLNLKRPIQFPTNGLSVIMWAYGVSETFYNDKGTIKYGPIQEGFKKYLIEMKKWYDEGLIAKDFAAPPTNNVVMTDGSAGCVYSGFNNITTWTSMAKNVPNYELVAAPYPSIEKGQKVDFKQKNYRAQQNCTAITTSCKEPWVAAKWLDIKFNDEFKMKGNYGEEGVTYTMKDGKPTYTDAAINNKQGVTLGTNMYNIAFGKGPFYRIVDRNWFTHLPNAVEAMDIWDSSSTGKAILPDTFMTMPVKEGEQFSAMMADITKYVNESTMKFITGTMGIDKWDSYVTTIKNMKIDEALKYKQQSYDRYNKR